MSRARILLTVVCILCLCIAGCFLLLCTKKPPDGIPAVTDTDRQIYLFTQGWKAEETCIREVCIPDADDPVFAEYAALQEQQGLPLAAFTGQTATRYTYRLAQSELCAELLCADGIVIGAARFDPATGRLYSIRG